MKIQNKIFKNSIYFLITLIIIIVLFFLYKKRTFVSVVKKSNSYISENTIVQLRNIEKEFFIEANEDSNNSSKSTTGLDESLNKKERFNQYISYDGNVKG
jgi:predicted Holliday junction resolvase-like endonuclease